MINNLFSIFDPSTRIFSFSLNWIRTVLGALFIPYMFWVIPSRYSFIWMKITFSLSSEFKILTNSKFNGGTLVFVSVFSLILFNNFLGIFPYVFTSTSHMVITISLALPLWLSFIIYGWLVNTRHIFIHLVPQGTPIILISFMVCIEMVSSIIRPGTLAIRLTANIIAGHLLITLLGNLGAFLSFHIVPFILIVEIALIILETAVAIIQAYVFAVLVTLYSREVV